MSRYHTPTKEAAQRQAAREDAMTRWVLDNLKPGMKCRFKGSRSNRIKGQCRVVLEVHQGERCARVGYPNPDYIEFDTKARWRTPEWEAAYEEYRTLPELNLTPTLFVARVEPDVLVTSKNEVPGRKTFGVTVADNMAVFLQEVEVDGRWVKIRELLRA